MSTRTKGGTVEGVVVEIVGEGETPHLNGNLQTCVDGISAQY